MKTVQGSYESSMFLLAWENIFISLVDFLLISSGQTLNDTEFKLK